MNERFAKVAVPDLELGMFVAELDRPWLETPFLIQGFVLTEFSQKKVLSEHCKHVYVDTGQSAPVGSVYEQKKPLKQSIAQTFSSQPLTKYNDTATFEEEMRSAQVIYADYEHTVSKLYDDTRRGHKINIQQVNSVVGNIVDSVIRNPDACAMLHKMRSKGDYLYNHAIGMSVWSAALSRQIGLPVGEIKKISLAALLCDIGKVNISKRILDKPGKLTADEFALIKQHVIVDESFNQRFPNLPRTVTQIIHSHHERHDGSGYPLGLEEDQIPVYTRIVAIADSYDAMTSDRPYSKAISPTEACRVLYELRDIHFQGEIVEEFIQCVGLYPVGTLVELNTGEVGVVISEYRKRRLRPRLLLLLDSDKQAIHGTCYLDLMQTKFNAKQQPIEIKCSLREGAYGLDTDDFFH